MNMIDITPVINAVIALLAAGVSVFLIPWIKSKTTDEQRKELLEWVKIGVAAAEQLYEGQGRGVEKKKYVPEFLASMGFTVDEDTLGFETIEEVGIGGNFLSEWHTVEYMRSSWWKHDLFPRQTFQDGEVSRVIRAS